MIEFTTDIEDILEGIEESNGNDLTETQQHIVNAVDTTRLLEEEGLYGFWMAPINHEIIMKTFDSIAAYELHDLFQSSQWCENKTAEQELNAAETSHLEDIESELIPLLEDLPEILQEFLEEE